ncbi:MAG: thioredoxin domain-containing protein [Candidatus Geothermincolia bacterium]
MKLKVFVSENCKDCTAAKELVKEMPQVEYFDVQDPDGEIEALFYEVFCTPSLLVTDDQGVEVQGWRCAVPSRRDLNSAFA